MKVLRVFVRRTSYTPDDGMAVIGEPGLFLPDAGAIDEVHISCVFSWDKDKAINLKKVWERYYSNKVCVKIGGPAFAGQPDEFISGRYVKKGITFTSRGCNFLCPWCLVPEREGKFREIEITPGNIVQDNNILLSSREHLEKVFAMLSKQKGIYFKGGLDCRLLNSWHVNELKKLSIKELWLALDYNERMKDFREACKMLIEAGFTRNQIRSYVLSGFNEPIQNAGMRLAFAYECGSLPYIQVYQDNRDKKRWQVVRKAV